MSSKSTGNAVNDDIIRLFLYGNKNGLGNYLSETVIRPDDDKTYTWYKVDLVDYMKSGPGRFAMPELFEVVRRFFSDVISRSCE